MYGNTLWSLMNAIYLAKGPATRSCKLFGYDIKIKKLIKFISVSQWLI